MTFQLAVICVLFVGVNNAAAWTNDDLDEGCFTDVLFVLDSSNSYAGAWYSTQVLLHVPFTFHPLPFIVLYPHSEMVVAPLCSWYDLHMYSKLV